MKRLVLILMLTLLCGSISVSAQSNYTEKQLKEFAKQAEKEAKEATKKLEKEKWQYNGVGSLQGAYTRYLLNDTRFGGTASLQTFQINNAPNMRNGEKSLMNHAQSQYAQENEAYLRSEQKSHSGEVDITLEDNVVKSLAEFNGDVRRAFSIYRKNSDGTFEMRGFFIIDSDNTRSKLRKLAKNLADEHSIGDEIKKRIISDDNE